MTLHQINQLAYSADLEATWQNSLKTGDKVLLIEEAVLRTTQDLSKLQVLIDSQSIEIFYLKSDVTAYGILPDIGKGLSNEEWVKVTFSSNKHISW